MRYLHRAGILHRDLKPQNILVDDNYYPKVCDFGFAKCFASALTNSMQLSMTSQFGTPLYMAPELFENDDHFSSAVDVYAFALIAYEIVTGNEPFFENGKPIKFTEIFQKVPNGERPKFDTNIQDKMKELIEKCWSQDPKDRPSFDEIFEKLSTDFSYSIEEVDNDEINEFLEILKENRDKNELETKHEKSTNEEETKNLQNEIDKLKNENEKYKNQIKDLQDEINNLKIEYKTKCLHIKICEFQKNYRFGKANPYVTLRLKNQTNNKVLSTKTISNTNELVWNEEFNLVSTDKRDDVLIINMYGEDPECDENMIDQLEFSISEWKVSNPVERKEIDTKLKKKKVGTLIFEVQAFRAVGEYSETTGNIHMKNPPIFKGNEMFIKLFMLHGTTCGQITISKRLAEGIYEPNVLPTIGVDFIARIMDVGKHKVKFQIWNSSAQERVRISITTLIKKNTYGFIIDFDVTQRESLERARYWFDVLKKDEFANIPIALVGNRIDLVDSREVSYEEGEQIAKQNGMKHFETSAKKIKALTMYYITL